ncbi:MAG: hypothetical protein SF187_17330 [Deltaproteobacteria bacterium]|nr:hypothetical protein [Deltaproteobacteria bacterium]
MWPVDVSYSWHDGSDLYFEDVGGKQRTVLTNRLLREPAAFFAPSADHRRKHYINSPGDGPQQDAWATAWLRIQGHTPATALYPPTQYVHAFWLNRHLGLLAIQYWFFYPFNDWVNRHEGDWEHVATVFKGPTALENPGAFTPVATFFYFHEWVHEAKQVLHLRGGSAAAKHPVVFVGGQGDMWNLWHCSHRQSGGSYPCAGRFANAGADRGWLVSPSEQVQPPARIILPEDFRLVMLPEPDHVSERQWPQLWWLRWNLFFGQRRIDGNLPLMGALALDHPPHHPGQHVDWNMRTKRRLWPGIAPPTNPLVLPAAVRDRLVTIDDRAKLT